MSELTQSYVEYFFPGVIVPETSEERNPEAVDVPVSSFAFRFYDKTEAQLDGGDWAAT